MQTAFRAILALGLLVFLATVADPTFSSRWRFCWAFWGERSISLSLESLLGASAGLRPVHATQRERAAQHLGPGALFPQRQNSQNRCQHR
jgi:hypothetical protein